MSYKKKENHYRSYGFITKNFAALPAAGDFFWKDICIMWMVFVGENNYIRYYKILLLHATGTNLNQ